MYCEGIHWCNLARNTDHWLALVNTEQASGSVKGGKIVDYLSTGFSRTDSSGVGQLVGNTPLNDLSILHL
jgi:hypothetical protein